LMTSSPREL